MAAVLDVTPESAWTALWRRLQQDRVGAVSLGIVVAYLVMIVFAGAGFLAGGWSRDVLDKAIKGSHVSIAVGVTAALCATLIGTLLGAFAGFYGRWVNDVLEWLYNVFTSIPSILLIFSLAAVLRSGAFAHLFASGIWTVVIILAFTGWTGMYRLVRAEYMKHRSREYVLAAQAIGASAASRVFVHILPNVSHVILVQLSLLGVAFI